MDFAPITGFQPNGAAVYGSDQQLYVFFFEKPVIDPLQSQERGMPIYKPVVFIHIQQPGERDFLEKPATDEHKHRFAAHWQKYREGQEQIPDGTPVDLLFPQNPEIPPTLKYLKIYTIQQLAILTEHGMSQIGMGGREWVQKAQQYLSQASNGKEYHALQKQLEDERGKREVSDQRVAALTKAVERLEAALQRQSPSAAPNPVVNDFGKWQSTPPQVVLHESDGLQQAQDAAPPPVVTAPKRGRPRKSPFEG